MNSPTDYQVPASVLAGQHIFNTDITVEAEHCEAEPDVGLSEGYEVFSAKLVIDENLRARAVDRLSVWVQGSATPVDVAVDPECLAKCDSIEIDDDDLRNELSQYLNSHP